MLFSQIIFYIGIVIVTTTTTWMVMCEAKEPNRMPNIADAVPRISPITKPAAPKCNGSAISVNATTASRRKSDFDLRFRLPLMDIEIQTQRNMRLVQEPQRKWLFLLHGNELFQMFVSRKEKRLSLIGFLDGGVRHVEHLGAEVVSYRKYLLLVVALEENLEVYQISEDVIVQRGEVTKSHKGRRDSPPTFDPIQLLTLPGKYRKIYLAEPAEDKVLLVAAVNYTKLYGRLKTYEWMNTYFDPVEEITVPPIHALSLIGKPRKYLISGRVIRQKSKTVLTTYEVMMPSMKLKSRQTLTVDSRIVHLSTYRGKNYLVACSSNQTKCSTFRMSSEGQFGVHRHRSGKELTFTHFTAGQHFLVGSRQDEILVYANARLDCYASFRSNETDVASIVVHVNEHDEDFILLSYVRPFHTIVRVVEIEDESGEMLASIAMNRTEVEEISMQKQHEHLFEDTIGRLRGILLMRREAMDVFRKIANILAPKMKTIRLKNPVTVRAGNVGVVKIVGKTLRSPLQLMNRIEDLAKRYGGQGRVKRFLEPPLNVGIEMPTRLKAQHLRVGNLIYNGSVIEGFHHDRLAVPLPILSIRTPIRTRLLETPELLTRPRGSPRLMRQPNLGLVDFDTYTMRTRKLHVKRINDVPWTEFYDSVFLKHRDRKIEGRLILQSESRVDNLWTPMLNGLAVNSLFNLVQPQVVHSDILVAGFFVSDLQAERVNDLDFANDIVFRGRDNVINTPVIMSHVSISGDLLMGDNTKMERAFGTGGEVFQQMYTGKVVLNGTLTVNNLLREDEAQVFVEGTAFSWPELKQIYLLNATEQDFSQPVFFGNARVSVPHLQTRFLNDHPTEQHLLRTTSNVGDHEVPLFLIFMLATIEKDLICKNYTSMLANISANAVRRGEVANITGTTLFRAPLRVDHLMTLRLNHLPVNELVLRSHLRKVLRLKGAKTVDKLLVRQEAIVENSLRADSLNRLPLNELLNYDYHLDNLTVPHKLHASNIVFHKINGISVDKIFTNFKVKDHKLVLHKDLIIDGNAQFTKNVKVDLVNDIAWDAYHRSLVRQHENAVIRGEKSFLNELVITKELQTPMVNNQNIEQIFDNILSKTKAQTISGSYSFDDLHVTNMDVSVINEMPTSAFIDTQSEEVIIDGDLVVPNLIVNGNVEGELSSGAFDVKTLDRKLQELPQKHRWRNVHVLGNAQWNTSSSAGGGDPTQYNQLAYLRRNAVTNRGNQVVSGNVRLRRPLISRMVTTSAFPKDIDFDFIAKDCLMKNSTAPQVVRGPKTFTKSLHMQRIVAGGLVGCNQLNNIDILRFNASLYRVSSGQPLMGPLHFQTPPVVGRLVVQGPINGVHSSDIYHGTNTSLPPLRLQQLTIDDSLRVEDINEMSLDYLLKNRITKNGEALEVFGFLTFENLILDKEILLQSINGIPIDSLVVKNSDNLQSITGSKTIEGNLILIGPSHVMRLNGRDLVESYHKSVFTHRNYHFDKLVVDQVIFEQGLTFASDSESTMLGSAQDDSTRLEHKIKQRDRVNAIERELAAIDNIVDNGSNRTSNKKHFMYLDYDFDVEILWQEPNATVDIDRSYSFDTNRLSVCERQRLNVHRSIGEKRLYLGNSTSSILCTSGHGWSVKVQNYCRSRYRKVRSKITITNGRLAKVFGMKKFIENIEIFKPTNNRTYLLLHAIDIAGKRNEVRLLQIDNNEGGSDIEDWQSITLGIGGKQVRLFHLSDNDTVLISSALVNNFPVLSIYHYSMDSELFKLSQVIDGDYDIIEIVPITAQRYHLLLSCVHCTRISIYEYMPSTTLSATPTSPPKFNIFQFVKLNQLIDKLLAFNFSDGSRYLLVLSENEHDYYHLYKLSHIQGWQHLTYGYFHNIQLALPLRDIRGPSEYAVDDNMSLLLCGNNRCNLVKALVQQ